MTQESRIGGASLLDQIDDLAVDVAETIIEVGTLKGFMIALFDGLDGRVLDTSINPDDIADYGIFLYWYGLLSNRPDFCDLVDRQMILQKRRLQTRYGTFALSRVDELRSIWTRRHRRSRRSVTRKASWRTNILGAMRPLARETFISLRNSLSHWAVWLRGQEDVGVGLYSLYLLSKESLYLLTLQEVMQGVCKHAIDDSGYLLDWFIPLTGRKSRTSSCEMSGLFIESLALTSELVRDESYLDAGLRIAHAWIGNEIFEQQAVFVDKWNVRNHHPEGSGGRLMKTNTNMMFGLLALYEQTQDARVLRAIERWLENLERWEYSEGVFFKSWNVESQSVDSSVDMTANHAALDVLLESYRVLRDEGCLSKALSGSRFWIAHQHENGLIPNRPLEHEIYLGENGEYQGYVSVNDTQADIAVIFLKAHELSGDQVFFEAANRGVLALHHYRKGHLQHVGWVDPRSGQTIDAKNKTKFLGGVLKGLTVAREYVQGRKFCEDDEFRLLARDR